MTDKLGLYNLSLLFLGERRLASLDENREPRRALDDAYDSALKFCLEQGFWNHAMRVAQIDAVADANIGYDYQFTKPTDWVRTYSVSSFATLMPFLQDYVDEGGYWYANSDPLYVKYVSSNESYGANLSLWSETFTTFVSTYLALRSCKRVTGNDPGDSLKEEFKKSKALARSTDAMNEPPGKFPTGSWVTSRIISASRKDG